MTAPPSGTPAGNPSSTPASTQPGILAVTTAGALVQVNPGTGSIGSTLVPSGVYGDEISVSPDHATVYYTQKSGCTLTVMSVSTSGGSPTPVAPGELPAISPDGTRLAFAQEPLIVQGCLPGGSNIASDFKLVIRTLGSGTQVTLPLPPQVISGGLFQPISHLSWAADSIHLAVSVSAVQDNEGWGVNIVDTSAAPYYSVPGPGVTVVPVTGSPTAQRSYLREGVFLPDGNLFVSRACCGGVPVHNTSRLMWEVTSAGVLVHQVAIGYPNLEHVSLAADPSGRWLLYLAGTDLYVSQDGNRPSKLASGFIAATWM
ncbi:MAG TPA: hypothetical protein VF834_13490 [Streptosporangiaceae bacterium]